MFNYTDDIAIYSFIGILIKSKYGISTDKTSIVVEFLDRLSLDNFELEVKSKLKSFFSKSSELEKVISDSVCRESVSFVLKLNVG